MPFLRPPSLSFKRQRSPELCGRRRPPAAVDHAPRPSIRAASARTGSAAPRATCPCPCLAPPCPSSPPQRTRNPHPWRRRGRPPRPRPLGPVHRGPVSQPPRPLVHSPAVDRPAAPRHVASRAGHPALPWPFYKMTPVVFSNQPAIHYSSKIFRIRSCF